MIFYIILLGVASLYLYLTAGSGYALVYKLKSRRKGYALAYIQFNSYFAIPFTKKALKAVKAKNLLEKIFEKNMDCPSTFYQQRLFQWTIYTRDPENVKTILATKFKDFDLGLREPQLAKAFGTGIFTSSGERWKHSRTMLRPQFSRDQISQLDSINDHTGKLIKSIEALESKDTYVDAQQLFHELTIDTATEFLLGESLDYLLENYEGKSVEICHNGRTITAAEFIESYTFMLQFSLNRIILAGLYPIVDSFQFRRHIDRARVFVDHYVELALRRDSKETVGSKYVFAWELAKVTRDPVVIRDQIFNILIAGRDTTATTLTYLTFFLARNPDILARLRGEVLENFGSTEENREVTFESLRASKFLNAVIYETLRLAPVVPLNSRTAVRDTELPRGGGPDGDQPIFVPKGIEVGYSVYVQHRDKSLWGEDAWEFKPDRWMEKQDIPTWVYLPFNGGPRICLGQQFAMTEIGLTCVRLLQKYSKITPSPELPVTQRNDMALTIRFPGKLLVRFEE